jgi:hypothetical protein
MASLPRLVLDQWDACDVCQVASSLVVWLSRGLGILTCSLWAHYRVLFIYGRSTKTGVGPMRCLWCVTSWLRPWPTFSLATPSHGAGPLLDLINYPTTLIGEEFVERQKWTISYVPMAAKGPPVRSRSRLCGSKRSTSKSSLTTWSQMPPTCLTQSNQMLGYGKILRQ